MLAAGSRPVQTQSITLGQREGRDLNLPVAGIQGHTHTKSSTQTTSPGLNTHAQKTIIVDYGKTQKFTHKHTRTHTHTHTSWPGLKFPHVPRISEGLSWTLERCGGRAASGPRELAVPSSPPGGATDLPVPPCSPGSQQVREQFLVCGWSSC